MEGKGKMEFFANEGKQVEIEVGEEIFLRHAIRTRFITPQDHYIDILKEYAASIYQDGDLVSISEKIISICQNRIVKREDMKIGFWANFLSKFASRTSPAGIGVGMPIKMQYAIDKVGLCRILLASIIGGIFKLFGKKGVFYKIAGQEVSGLDGFDDRVWKEYKDIGIEIPCNSRAVCNEIKDKLGISCMIVDSNELGQEILGKSADIQWDDETLKQIIRDNPAGQGQYLTPMILIRRGEKCDSAKIA